MIGWSQAIEHYFDLLEKTLKDNGLLNKPAMLMKLGWLNTACASNVKLRTSANKAQTMVVACVNAIGQAIPPYVIYNLSIGLRVRVNEW